MPSSRRRALPLTALLCTAPLLCTALLLCTAMLLCTALLAGSAVATPAAAAPAAAPIAPTAARGDLAQTPPMGFNNWNAFGCDVSETLMKQTADVLVSSGLAAAGYRYVNIDDCWSLRERGPDGRLVPDPVKFPGGIRGVADYVHSRGLKLGIYGDAGTKTCAGYPGSLGREVLDARTWADWGVDYLKYDNCYNQSDGSQADFIRRYTAMRDALRATGRPIVYAVCEWGQSRPWEWATGVGQLWRTGGDISDNWTSLRTIIAGNAPLYPFAGPGHWNDPDMLEIGNGGMTDTEYRTHMSMWAMMAAPLLIGTDLRTASPATMAILGNRDIIAIDQDRLGVQGRVVRDSGGLLVLDKPLANGDRAIALYNSTDALATVSVAVGATGLRRAGAYRLTDVWTGETRQARSTISAAVAAHGTVVYRVRPLRDPDGVAPLVTVGAGLGTLVPGTVGGGALTTTVTNRGVGTVRRVGVDVRVPAGWTVSTGSASATTTGRRGLPTDATLETLWTVRVPEGTPAGRYPVTVTATYEWGSRHRASGHSGSGHSGSGHRASASSVVVGEVVTAPADGRRHLSTISPVRSANAHGPVETDRSNGGAGQGDGALPTIGGRVYTRGLGTTAPSEIVYYLGGRCSRLVTDVGIDDEATTPVPATFTVYADDVAVASSGPIAAGESARTLTADLTGAAWLRLVTTGSGPAGDGTTVNDHADWAVPVLSCGQTAPDAPVLPVERTVFGFESGTDGFTLANEGDGGDVEASTVFTTEGGHGLRVLAPVVGNWFGHRFVEPLDLTGATALKFDVRATASPGTTGEIAVQYGPDWTWCQGSNWAWTNAGSSRSVAQEFRHLGCPGGAIVDPAQIRAIWLFLNGREVYVDNVRAEY